MQLTVEYTLERSKKVKNIDKEILQAVTAEAKRKTELIEQEFSLPYFEFVYDEHWDLGHGWSGDMK